MVFSLLPNEGNAVYGLLDDERLRESGVVTRGLAADADFAALCAAGGDDLGDHLFYGGVPFVEDGRDDPALGHDDHTPDNLPAEQVCRRSLPAAGSACEHDPAAALFVRCLLPLVCGASPPGGLTRGFGLLIQGGHRRGRLC